LGNACYHSDQNILACYLLTKNLKMKHAELLILPVVLCICETWCHMREHWLGGVWE